jgi:hypothetical protein
MPELGNHRSLLQRGGDFIMGKEGFTQNFSIKRIVLINFPDAFDNGIQGFKLVTVYKSSGVEFPPHFRVSPIDRDGVRRERMNQFFRGVADGGGILDSNRKLAFLLKLKLVARGQVSQ